MRRWLKRLLVAGLLAGAACGVWLFWYSHRDDGAIFLKRKGQLVETRREIVSKSAVTTVTELHLRSDTGLLADVRMRAPNRPGSFPCVLLAVGLGTGQRVIELVQERDDLVMLAVDYGWREEFNVSTLREMRRTLGSLRAVSNFAVPRMLLALDFAAHDPQIDHNRIIIVGVSYGTYLALPAAALDGRVAELILVQGGGEIGATVAANAERWRAALSPRAAGALMEFLFEPFKPQRWIAGIAPRPVTFIASRTDPTLPVGAVESVFARAGEPKKLVWHDTPHVEPRAQEIIAELSRVVFEELGKSAGDQN